jgi:hypothetical protein
MALQVRWSKCPPVIVDQAKIRQRAAGGYEAAGGEVDRRIFPAVDEESGEDARNEGDTNDRKA